VVAGKINATLVMMDLIANKKGIVN